MAGVGFVGSAGGVVGAARAGAWRRAESRRCGTAWTGAPRRAGVAGRVSMASPAVEAKTGAKVVKSLKEQVWSVNRVNKFRGNEGAQKKVAIVGAGLGALSAAIELLDAGFQVELFEGRPFVGGKVGSWEDADGNHIEMGLHVFFGCYYNLFDLMNKLGVLEDNFLDKEHTHQFVNTDGVLGALDFRMGPIGAPINGLKAFFTTEQLKTVDKLANALALGTSPIVKGLVNFDAAMKDIRDLDDVSFTQWFTSKGGSRGSIERMWNPIAYALGFLDCDTISARCMLTIFILFAIRSEASKLKMLKGSPHNYLTKPMVDYIEARGGKIHLRRFVRSINYVEKSNGDLEVTGIDVALGAQGNVETINADIVVAACDVPGIQKLLPATFRKYECFENVYKLSAVPVITVQLRFNGWVTELNDMEAAQDVSRKSGLDNLLYSADVDYSCFADLALTSPADYYREGQGSLLQVVITPADGYMPKSDAFIVDEMIKQTRKLFPSARLLECTWSNVHKLAQSLYREAPGMDPFRPPQRTPVDRFFLAGSYTYQDYIDSMEGAVKSGRMAADEVIGYVTEQTSSSSSNPASS
ncbi:Zeta-carotene desaturase [Porphyridium purpureum]|uniref:Zeta-carotene desaturase, chloroplastic/chromoplastic n=1 Tax=Porphyridium purpureum TaxID=35688 RepID=A0A5J4YUZ7_PORPP|nr:Zeta-carotene desaturase [Porphyridium purpureum]|eukprot:POR7067..scf227_4